MVLAMKDFKFLLDELDKFKEILPEPTFEKIEGSRLGYRHTLSENYIFHSLMYGYFQRDISRIWVRMYEEVTLKVAKMMIGNSYWYVLKFDPRYLRSIDSVILELYCDINIAMTSKIVVPEYIYDLHNLAEMPKEWRCGYCKSPNKMEDRHCTQCGAARTLLIQEM